MAFMEDARDPKTVVGKSQWLASAKTKPARIATTKTGKKGDTSKPKPRKPVQSWMTAWENR